jgi:superfamily I DNA/RNA helicase
LVLTFSNEAAQELEERIADRFGEQIAARIRISTFHGFGVAFLHHHGQLAGLDALVLDEAGQGELVNSILGKADCEKLLKLKRPSETAKRIVEHINYLKNRLLTPESLAAALDQLESGGESGGESGTDFSLSIHKPCANRSPSHSGQSGRAPVPANLSPL